MSLDPSRASVCILVGDGQTNKRHSTAHLAPRPASHWDSPDQPPTGILTANCPWEKNTDADTPQDLSRRAAASAAGTLGGVHPTRPHPACRQDGGPGRHAGGERRRGRGSPQSKPGQTTPGGAGGGAAGRLGSPTGRGSASSATTGVAVPAPAPSCRTAPGWQRQPKPAVNPARRPRPPIGQPGRSLP